MLSEKMKQKWQEACEAEDWHTLDPTFNFMELRIHDDVPSMMQAPIAWEPEDLTGEDAAFIGIPWEGAVGSGNGNSWSTCGPKEVRTDVLEGRTGAWSSPDYIRKCSKSYAIHGSGLFCPEVSQDFRVMDHIEIMDYANVNVDTPDSEKMARNAIAKVGDIVRAGAVPLVFGGDHSIPYPVVKAISDNTEGKTGVIWFDSHYDIGFGGPVERPYNTLTRLNAENAIYRIVESCDVDLENICIIGISSPNFNSPAMGRLAKELGVTVFTREDVCQQGIKAVTEQALEIVNRGTERTYVSFDLDALDALTFPAQKYVEPFGISFQDAITALRTIVSNTNTAGMDLCCMGPAYDVNGLGGVNACRMYIEILKGLALKKMAKRSE